MNKKTDAQETEHLAIILIKHGIKVQMKYDSTGAPYIISNVPEGWRFPEEATGLELEYLKQHLELWNAQITKPARDKYKIWLAGLEFIQK